jgi:hypothetical protein
MVPIFKKSKEPAPRALPGWLRSRFMLAQYPKENTAPCGRPVCPVCGEAPIQCEELHSEPTEKERP